MAEEEKILILSVELDLNQFSEAAKEAEKSLEALLVEQEKMRFESKQGTTAYAELSAQIQATRKQLNDNAKALRTVKDIQEKNTGSIAQMRKELSAATLQYNNLSKSERENTQIGGRLQKQIRGLTDDLKRNGNALGDNRMNVGNYGEAIRGAISGTNLFSGSLGSLSGLMGSGGAFGIALAGTIGLFKGLETAIGFTNSGAEFLERRTAGIGAAFDVVKGKIAAFANTASSFPIIGALFNLPSDIANIIAGDEIVAAGEKIKGEFQDIEDAERDLGVQTSANNVLIDQYIARSKNRTLVDKERLDILKQASELEKANLEAETALEQRRLNAQQSENARLKQAGVLTDDDLKKATDIQIKINQLKQQSLALQERIQTRQDTILDNAQKKREEDLKKQIELEKKKQAELQKIGKAIFVDDYKALLDKRDDIDKQAASQRELEITNNFNNGLITEQQFAEQLLAVKIENLNKEIETLKLNGATEVEVETETAAKKLEIATLLADSKIDQAKKVTAKLKEEQDKQEKAERERADIIQDFISGLGSSYADSLEENILNTDKFTKKVAILLLDTLKRSIQTQIKLSETSNIAIATAGAIAQPDSIATAGVTGIIRAAILTGLIEAAFQVIKSQIQSDSFGDGGIVPMAEKGIIIGGKPHSQGGTKFVGSDGTRFEAEKDELLTVVNKRSTAVLKNLSGWNSMNGWGVDFFKTSPHNYLQDGGFAARSVSSPVITQVEQQAAMNAALNSLNGKFVVLVEDINSAQGKAVRVASKSVLR